MVLSAQDTEVLPLQRRENRVFMEVLVHSGIGMLEQVVDVILQHAETFYTIVCFQLCANSLRENRTWV